LAKRKKHNFQKKIVFKNYVLGIKFKISFSKHDFNKSILRKWVIKRPDYPKEKKSENVKYKKQNKIK
jgi:hypothetical protein